MTSQSKSHQPVRAIERLRAGVEGAIVDLGTGFSTHPDNRQLRQRLHGSASDRGEFYRQLLHLTYRIIFLLTAEAREVLLDPGASEPVRARYRQHHAVARLRELVQGRRQRSPGDAHGNSWRSLNAVMTALHAGDSSLGLPALGSRLWGPEACPWLIAGSCDDRHLLAAVAQLSYFEDNPYRDPVDWREISAHELGSIYECLLERHPRIHAETGVFELATAAGHQRKTTGSYYTPTSLIERLLDSALDPVLERACGQSDPEAALLALTVCDPACGAGHFLVAAARRIARRLAAVRSVNKASRPVDMRAALRDVVGRCIYGVDIDPMAVELCKISLWLEAPEPGRPLSFLDHYIRCGDALLGATPALMARGIPDHAFKPLTGDDRAVARRLKQKNKRERERPPSPAAAQQRSVALEEAWFQADAWCAAFVWPMRPGEDESAAITHEVWQRLQIAPISVGGRARATVRRLAREYRFFHWHLAFPDVFRSVDQTSETARDPDETSGFDVVLGNPPWERLKLQEKEFFGARNSDIARARNAAARKRLIAGLQRREPDVWHDWQAALRRSGGRSALVRDSGRYPLCGRGDINTYSVFSELNRQLLTDGGRAGFIVPSSIATDATTRFFFSDLMTRGHLRSMFAFREIRRIFPDTDSRQSFALLTISSDRSASTSAQFAFDLRGLEDLEDPERRFALSHADVALLNPNTGTCPVFRTRRDAELTKAIYRRIPLLWREGTPGGNPWQLSFKRMLDMATDSGLFASRQQLLAAGWTPEGNSHVRQGERMLPLYEAKMAHHFHHRFGDYADKLPSSRSTALPAVPSERLVDPGYTITPRYWVADAVVEARLQDRWDRGWLLGWRDICRSTDARTVVASVIPRTAVNDKFLLMLPGLGPHACLVANLHCLVFDYLARQKLGGTSLKYFTMRQLPVIPPDQLRHPRWAAGPMSTWIQRRVLELVYTAWDLQAFARDCGYHGPPFRWDEERRSLLRYELDAAFFHFYGIERDDVAYIAETFSILARREREQHGEYQSKRVILDIHDQMQRAIDTGEPYRTRLQPPPADPRVAHVDAIRPAWARGSPARGNAR